MRELLFLLFFAISLVPMQAQVDTLSVKEKIFHLGEVMVVGDRPDAAISIVKRDEMIKRNQSTIAAALGEIPGITLTNSGSRNENTVFLRGYDTRQVALLVDGIPVYIPYDGNIDLGRFLSFNYEKVVIEKGFSSLLYGPNTMGGVINLVTAEPVEKFELQADAKAIFGNTGYNGNSQNLRLGSSFGKFFVQGTYTRNDLDNWDPSKKYEPLSLEETGKRLNSFEHDQGLSLRLGYSPQKFHKYVLTYSMLNGKKGIPVYDGVYSSRFWKMPEWDKRSLYLNSSTQIIDGLELVTRWYFDSFTNTLESYDDISFSTQQRNYAFTSYYDDYSLGNSFQLISKLLKKNETSISFQFKNDNHQESTAKEADPVTSIVDNTISFGAENRFQFNEKTRLVAGISYHYKENQEARQFYPGGNGDELLLPSGNDHAFNYMAGVDISPAPGHNFWLHTSENSRFATMKERYSYRLGRSIPNPDLGSERAGHLNLGYRYRRGKIEFTSEFFISRGKDKIAYVNINPDTMQYQNIERSMSYGTDLKLDFYYAGFGKFRIDYSYLELKNLDDQDFYFTLIPKHNLGIENESKFANRFTLILSYRYISERNSYTDGSYPADPYGIVDADFTAILTNFMDLRFYTHNLFDVCYLYSEGYPARGRNFGFGLSLNFDGMK